MKTNRILHKNILLLVFSAVSFSIYGQGTIKTPLNHTVYVNGNWDTDSLIAVWEADAADWINDHNSDAVRIGPATSNYNCHAYAWHVSDGGDSQDCWLNNIGTNLSQYWTNDAYISTSSPNEFNKVFYGTIADHSAISTASGDVKSKWGAWPLYEHETTDCPYDNISITFYKIPVSGDDLICTSKTYSSVNISGATYNWSGSRISTEGTNDSTTATKTSDGKGWIHTEISSPYSGTTVKSEKKELWVGVPVIDNISGPLSTPNNQWATYYAEPNNYMMAATDYNWILNPLNGNSVYDYGWSCDIAFCNPVSYQLVVQAQNTCSSPGYGPYYVAGLYVYDSKSLLISPNPTTGTTTLSIKSTSKENSFDKNAEWELEIYSQNQLLKEKKTSLRRSSTTIQTSGWKEGVYFVRVNYKDEVLQGKLVVKK